MGGNNKKSSLHILVDACLFVLLQGEDGDLEVVNVQTAENEKYQCVIPESQASKDAVSTEDQLCFASDIWCNCFNYLL